VREHWARLPPHIMRPCCPHNAKGELSKSMFPCPWQWIL